MRRSDFFEEKTIKKKFAFKKAIYVLLEIFTLLNKIYRKVERKNNVEFDNNHSAKSYYENNLGMKMTCIRSVL